MRAKLIATVLVLVLSVTVCVASMQFVFSKIDQMEYLTSIVQEHVDAGDTQAAREALAQMAEIWSRSGDLLRAVTPHDDLHDVTIQYTESTSNLEADDMDDFRRSMSLLTESLKHLRDYESLSWSNLL